MTHKVDTTTEISCHTKFLIQSESGRFDDMERAIALKAVNLQSAPTALSALCMRLVSNKTSSHAFSWPPPYHFFTGPGLCIPGIPPLGLPGSLLASLWEGALSTRD